MIAAVAPRRMNARVRRRPTAAQRAELAGLAAAHVAGLARLERTHATWAAALHVRRSRSGARA
jgi:hypothetical protein